jgi:hypothetical protein
MELHAVEEGVIVDRAGVGSASTKGLKQRRRAGVGGHLRREVTRRVM